MNSNLEKETGENCGDSRRKWLAIGIVPTGIVSIGVVPMGIISIGVVPMGVVSLGAVAMGTIATGFVSMGLFTIGNVTMGLNSGHFSNLTPTSIESPHEQDHHH